MPTVAIDARDARAPDARGWGRYARELIAALGRQGWADVREATAPGLVAGAPELAWEQVWWPLRLARQRPDLIHAPNCFLPLVRPCPGVVTVHDLAFEVHRDDFAPRTGWKYRTFTPRSVRSAQRVICVSAFTAADVSERYGADPERVRVIPNAPALAIGDAPAPGGAPYLLAVGDVRAKKNLGRLVQAWRALRETGALPDHRLVLAGADPGGRGAALAQPGLELTGYVDDARLDALMRGADVLVHPSLYEGFGLVLLEAMARGTPVAAARATALPETGGDAAEWFDPLDPDDIAAAILRALGDRERLAAAGRARAALVTWDATAEATALVYREVL
jgi:glycosyltransferase involved in cell wall biosynthesis